MGRRAFLAGRAGAVGKVAHHHVVSRLYLLYGRAHLLHDACPFMAEYGGQRGRQMLISHRKIGVAETAPDNAHQDLVYPRLVEVYLFDKKGTCFFTHHGGLNFHPRPPFLRMVWSYSLVWDVVPAKGGVKVASERRIEVRATRARGGGT